MSIGHDSVVLAMVAGKLSLPRLSDLTMLDWILTCFLIYATWTIYDVYLGPMSKFPGPALWAASRIPKIYVMWTGEEANAMLRLHERYGPVVRIAPRRLSYCNAAAWKAIHGRRTGFETKTFVKDHNYYIFDSTEPVSMHIANDADHDRHRQIMANSFSDKALREQEPLLKRWVSYMIVKLKEIEKTGKPVDLVKYYNFTTFDIMGDLTFAEPLNMLEGSDYIPWVKLIFGSIKDMVKVNAIKELPYMPEIIERFMPDSVRQQVREHFKFSADRVDRRLARDPGRPDLWTDVLKRSGTTEAGKTSKMSIPEMHANSKLFMTAGTETTATSLSGLTYHLLRAPAKLEKLVAELRSSFTSEADISVDTLAKLPYLNACIEEGLRIYPAVPVGLPRIVPSPGATICNHKVPGKTIVSVSHWSAGHTTANFRNPSLFIPERWLGDPEYASDDRDAIQPFSFGPRNCLGKNLAYHELRLLLAVTLWHFDLELQEESWDWTDQKVFLLWDKKPLMVKLRDVGRLQ